MADQSALGAVNTYSLSPGEGARRGCGPYAAFPISLCEMYWAQDLPLRCFSPLLFFQLSDRRMNNQQQTRLTRYFGLLLRKDIADAPWFAKAQGFSV